MQFTQDANTASYLCIISLAILNVHCIHYHSPLEKGKIGASPSHGQGLGAHHLNESKEDFLSNAPFNNSLLKWFLDEHDKTASAHSADSVSSNINNSSLIPEVTYAPPHPPDNDVSSQSPLATTKKPAKKSKQKNRLKNRQQGKSKNNKGLDENLIAQTSEPSLVDTTNGILYDATKEPASTASLQPQIITNEDTLSTTANVLHRNSLQSLEQPKIPPESDLLNSSSVDSELVRGLNKTSNGLLMNANSQSLHSDFALIVVVLLGVCMFLGLLYYKRREKQQQLERMSQQLLPNYSYNPTDDQDDWENKLISQSVGLKSKPQVASAYSDVESSIIAV
ncbi:uncharacterized protein LOC108683355 [Hyalella azteca]|uniref:Uncharacterized protein LOC108683355 n=1 Tax=Hyalella azteca TaxID=294128 RepID=A0A8B7PSJ0_HYAAZ|nr:uncharacterized protein LOC108683355 [Hyalella azteca]XP_047735446.1 uncharacterized protein LOC108683355 [Hyalella azteca]